MDDQARLHWYQRRVAALERLLKHYRTATLPSEALHQELAATREWINSKGNWVPDSTPTRSSDWKPDEMSDLHLP